MKRPLTFLLFNLLWFPLAAQEPDPKSLQFTKWTPDFQIPNPVAISFDEQGRAYVTQTQRRKANDLDIRNNTDWIATDLGLKTPDEKQAFYHLVFNPANSEANKKRVKDYNNDGSHDYADLRSLTERVYLIEDTDGNGTADKSSVFADEFDSEITGIAAGVLHHDGDVYVTAIPDLWKLQDTDDDGKADQRDSLVYGFGPHIALGGHDMHGLIVGPDGRIYWTVGDKGVGVTSKEGRVFKYPNQGAVLRCEPDGSNFEVYARGLRNVQEIAFDQYGNLFGVDNDSDQKGEKERFVYIVQHMDAGWRCNWQYRKGDYNPWIAERLHVPYEENQPAYILPPISLYHNGPTGLAFNPGTALSEEWQDYFFHTSAPNGQQWAFQIEQDGASFKMTNSMQIGNGVPIIGINFGPDGALYGVDWGGGYPLNEKGAIWKWDTKERHPLRDETAKLLKADFSEIETPELILKLNHPDQRIRLKAQFELVRKEDRPELYAVARKSPQLSRIHAIWGLAQIMRNSFWEAGKFLALAEDPDPEIRFQVLRSYGELLVSELSLHQAHERFDNPFQFPAIEELLKDRSERVKFQAAVALGNLWTINKSNQAAQAILKMARAIDDEGNTYLRHAAIVGLTGCASSKFLTDLVDDESEFIQKIAVVALRRRADPKVRNFLYSPFKNVVAEAARAIHDDWSIPEAMPDLANALAEPSADPNWLNNEPFIRRAINANFHLGTAEAAQRVADFAIHENAPEELRLNALDALGHWTKPKKLDRVVGRFRPLPERDAAIARIAVSKNLSNLLTSPSQEIQSTTMKIARTLQIKIPANTLVAVSKNEFSLPSLRIEALRSLGSQNHKELQPILSTLFKSDDPTLRIEALRLLAKSNPSKAFVRAEKVLSEKDGNIFEQQAVLALLGEDLASEKGDAILGLLLTSIKGFPAPLKLDLVEAATTRNLKSPPPDFAHTLEGGDAARGKNIFMNHIAAQCIRCHKVEDGKGSDIGPNLKSIGQKDRSYLLESLIDPQKTIASGFGSISLTLKDGSSVSGLFQAEKNNKVQIRDLEGKVAKIKAEDIKERSPVITTMPPMGQILTKREIRDVVEYLSSLKSNKKK